MNHNQAKDFLGVGWKFPVEVDEATGRIKTSSFEEDIKEAIQIIIMTSKGERLMRPNFGCDMREQLFEGMDYATISQMESEIKVALTSWEPRIEDVEVTIKGENQGGNLMIDIHYLVRATNNRFNVVYPYFLTEGE